MDTLKELILARYNIFASSENRKKRMILASEGFI